MFDPACMSQIRKIRKTLGLTQEGMAEIAGCTAQYIGQLERGERRIKTDFITDLVKNLHAQGYTSVRPSDFLEGENPATYSFAQTAPVYGQPSGASGSSMSLNDRSVVDHAPVRPNMGNEGFFMIVIGDSMEPRYEQGERIAVNRTLPPKKGKDCVIEFIDGTAVLRRFLSMNEKTLACEQLNPQKKLTYSMAEVTAVYAVVGNEY